MPRKSRGGVRRQLRFDGTELLSDDRFTTAMASTAALPTDDELRAFIEARLIDRNPAARHNELLR